MLVNREVKARIVRKLLLNEPELIEKCFKENLLLEEPMDSCFGAMSWIDEVGDHFRGYNRDGRLQTIRSSTDGSMLHGVFEIDKRWYKSSFKTGRLFFRFWGTDVGCLANVPEEEIDILLEQFTATTYTHLKAEFSSVLNRENNNNAFFSWKNSVFCGCIQHSADDGIEVMVDSEFRIRMSKQDFFMFIRPYVFKTG